MSIAEFPVATLTTERVTATLPGQKLRRKLRATFHISPLWLCLLIALALRVWLTVRTHGVIDGDEAMVGIQAEHILRGERPLPIYFYGQAYMGSLEAYLVAFLFKIVGPWDWALRAEPILLSAFQLTRRWHEGAASKELALRWAGIGFITSVGLWVDPLIASAILTAALMKRLLLVVTAIPAFLTGAFPAIYWGMQYHWANVTYLLQSGNQPVNTAFQQIYPTRLDVFGGMVWFYSTVMIPRLIGGALPREEAISATLHTTTTLIGLLCICITLVFVVGSVFLRQRLMQCVRQLVMLPLLNRGIVCVFCYSVISTRRICLAGQRL